MHFDSFLSVLEQKTLRFTTMDLLSYPLDFCSALLSVDGAPLAHIKLSDTISLHKFLDSSWLNPIIF
jgi:hypothetical protein